MASLALGIVGGLIGGPIGFLAGSLIGNLLFPQKIDGPRLSDLHLHTSSYGGMTPIVYGTMRVAGTVDWETDLTEHKSTSGGKGGPEVTTYTYSASFGVTLCEGPIAGVRKIWANGRKIYDRSDPVPNQGDLPFTVYTGAEDQLPDPTMEAHLGVGNVPAYRGLGRVVFTDWMLTDYSNTIPSLNFEVYTATGGIPRRISSFAPAAAGLSGVMGATYDPGTKQITVGTYVNGGGGGHPPLTYSEHYFLLDGTEVGTPIVDASLSGADLNANVCYITNSNIACFPTVDPGVGTGIAWYVHGTRAVDIIGGAGPYGTGVILGNYLYCSYGPPRSGINRYPVVDGLPAAFPDLSVSYPGSITFGTSDNGRLYVWNADGQSLAEFDADLVLLHTWLSTDFPAGFFTTSIYSFNSFVRYNNFFAFSYAGLGFDLMNLVSVAADYTLTLYPQERVADVPTYGYVHGPMITLTGGLVLGLDGVTSLDPVPQLVTLASIVADLSKRAGLAPSQYDVTGLPDLVRGYLVSQQQAVRADIDPLRQAFFFDGSEVDDKIVFVKRGGKSVVEIPDDELAAHKYGDTPPPLLVTE